MVMMPARVSAAIASDCTAASAWVQTSRRRRSIRSISTPANGARRKVNICPAKPTTPSSHAEWVSRHTSQLVAMRVIQVPMSEMLWPATKSLKLRCRRARQACENRPRPVGRLSGVVA